MPLGQVNIKGKKRQGHGASRENWDGGEIHNQR